MRKIRRFLNLALLFVMLINSVFSNVSINHVSAAETVEQISIASGVSGAITWEIDNQGCLYLTGDGDFVADIQHDFNGVPEWILYQEDIVSAVVNVTNITSVAFMFDSLYNLRTIDFINFSSTGDEIDLAAMFYYCNSLESLDTSNWNITNIIDADIMFFDCPRLKSVDLSGLDLSAAGTEIEDMIYECNALEYIKTPKNLESTITLWGNYWVDDNNVKYDIIPKGLDYSVELFLKDLSELDPMIEISGYQINTAIEGFRTVYSVSDPNNIIETVGLIYGLADTCTEEDLIINTNNPDVYSYSATENGALTNKYSQRISTTSYAMTMKYGTCNNDYLIADSYVRAYAKLTDGTYIYSDVVSYNIYNVADIIYKNNFKGSKTEHEYLYNEILSVVNPDYEKVAFNGNSTLITP